MKTTLALFVVCNLFVLWISATIAVSSIQFSSKPTLPTTTTSFEDRLSKLVYLRGGEGNAGHQIRGKKPTGAVTKAKEWLSTIQPISRAYILLAVFCSVVHTVGLPAPSFFSLDPTRFYEIWRPFTAVAYLGPINMSMVNNLFFLLRFGQTLETEQGPGPFAWYLLVQTAMLTLLGWLLGFPFQAQAMISSIIHVCSRMSPMDQIPFQFGLMITSWQLPFCMMAIDCLSQQSLSPAWPHLLGIFSGHVFLFATKIWPALGGKARLQPPAWILSLLGDKPASNVPGMDFRAQKRDKARKNAKEAATAAASAKKRGSSMFGFLFGAKKKVPSPVKKTGTTSGASSAATAKNNTANTSSSSSRTAPTSSTKSAVTTSTSASLHNSSSSISKSDNSSSSKSSKSDKKKGETTLKKKAESSSSNKAKSPNKDA